jgi:hypothetical protein
VRRLDTGFYYYAFHKPHQGLNGATPAELYFGPTPAHTKAKRPLGEFELKKAEKPESDKPLFEVAYLDSEHLLPVLVPLKKTAQTSPGGPPLHLLRQRIASVELCLLPASRSLRSSLDHDFASRTPKSKPATRHSSSIPAKKCPINSHCVYIRWEQQQPSAPKAKAQ